MFTRDNISQFLLRIILIILIVSVSTALALSTFLEQILQIIPPLFGLKNISEAETFPLHKEQFCSWILYPNAEKKLNKK